MAPVNSRSGGYGRLVLPAGNDNKWLHYCQVLALTFVVAVTLAAITDLARPFEGAVSVSPLAFERALTMTQ